MATAPLLAFTRAPICTTTVLGPQWAARGTKAQPPQHCFLRRGKKIFPLQLAWEIQRGRCYQGRAGSEAGGQL